MNHRLNLALAGSSLLVIASTLAAHAQQATSSAASEQIVVTGTQIRGITPVGTESVDISAEQIMETPGVSTDQVLATIPEVSNLFNRQIGLASGAGSPTGVNSPMIHGLPTLVLLDGHRIAPAGSALTGVDPSIIPKGVLSGIEVVPDGGSSLYGSDAVGGVINLTTKKRFDGVEVDGDVGLASDTQNYRLDVTAGKSWDSGSVYLAYDFDKQTPLFGYDRPYVKYIGANPGCAPSTVSPSINAPIPPQFGGGFFVQPLGISYNPSGIGANGKPTGYTVGTTQCNEYTNESLVAEEHEHSVFAGWSQDLSSSMTLDTRAFYSTRRSTAYNVFNTTTRSATVPQSNFYYTPTPAEAALGPAAALALQTVGFSYDPPGGNKPSPTRLDTWGASSQLTADLGHEFQGRALANFSRSYVKSVATGIDSGLQSSSLASNNQATALDPYEVNATPQSATVANEIDSQQTTTTGQTDEFQARLVADGPLFHLPAGEIKIAFGGEVLHDAFNATSVALTYNGGAYTPPQQEKATRTVASTFGELNIPLISPDNNVSLIHKFDFSAAGRYDHYSDFGSTFNPRFATALMPTDWWTFRATWGRSFVAPQLYQELQPGSGTVINAISFLLPPGDTADLNKTMIIVQGGNPGLQPQKAKTWTVGTDVKVPFIDGLKLSLGYYNSTYNNQIGTAPFTNPSLFFSGLYSNFLFKNPSLTTAQKIIGNNPVAGNGVTSLAQLYGPGGAIIPTSPVYIEDIRFGNLGTTETGGLDFDVNYTHRTSFGSVNFDFGGNYILVNRAQGGPGIPFVDQLLTTTKLQEIVSAGADVGRFHTTVTLLHTGGFGLTPGVSPIGQTNVSAYDVVNAFFSYTLKGEGVVNGTEIHLNINNLFNVRPAVNTTTTLGYAGESFIGRTFQLGFHKKF